jgi:hypothetical protein
MYSYNPIVAAAALLALTGSAHAVELFTSVSESQNTSRLACVIVNVGSKPITVAATLQAYKDGSNINFSSTCPASPATLAPGAGCTSIGDNQGDIAGYCHFTTSNPKVRAALLAFDQFGDVTSTLPATK